MSKFIQLTVDDIVKHWDVISHAYAETSFLVNKDHIPIYLQNTLLELLSGRRIVFVILNDDMKFQMIIGLREMRYDINIDAVKSLVIGPVYGFEPTSNEDKIFFFEKLKEYKRNVKADKMYFYSPLPIAWNVAEKMGMKFAAKVYTD